MQHRSSHRIDNSYTDVMTIIKILGSTFALGMYVSQVPYFFHFLVPCSLFLVSYFALLFPFTPAYLRTNVGVGTQLPGVDVGAIAISKWCVIF